MNTSPNNSLTFKSEGSEDMVLVFTLQYPSELHSEKFRRIEGRGVFYLSSLKDYSFGHQEILVREHKVLIQDLESTKCIAIVTFNLLIITPFDKPPALYYGLRGFWKDDQSTSIIGHRGSGANKAKEKYLQIGENTIQGFLSAEAMGASCIEFDVQLTKDYVPVIYHDFSMKDTGTETPISSMTKLQFLYVGKSQDTRGDVPSAAEIRFEESNRSMPHAQRKSRSRSCGSYDDSRAKDLVNRLRVTSYGPTKAVKGNRRGFTIQEPLATLEEMLDKLPESIAFDLEMKYPMLWEVEDQGLAPWGMEANFFVDTILEMISARAGQRDVVFSSFSPEICILLSVKQQTYPVLFITKAGNVPVGDERCSSLQQALAFSRTWNLAGVVTIINPIQYCPRLINYAQASRCKCATYGTTSDDPETVKMLSDAGLDGIVTNRVGLISQTLRDHHRQG